jgi:hypothetical protein
VDAIAHQLMRVRSGESRRLLINQPPRSLKSICVSVAYVAWLLGHDPTRHVVVASYSGDFAAELHPAVSHGDRRALCRTMHLQRLNTRGSQQYSIPKFARRLS